MPYHFVLEIVLVSFPASAEVTFASDQTEGGRESRQEAVGAGYSRWGWLCLPGSLPLSISQTSGKPVGLSTKPATPNLSFFVNANTSYGLVQWFSQKHCFRATWGAPRPQFLVQQAWVRALEFAFVWNFVLLYPLGF